ncbi:TPA: nucleotidyltransferase domain-containing protein [Candidatus Bathyarchaeota archaeon]|nr:nucleotidyltransferase domain-containing protein [Candidatus Bathyarchaeota archaeon]
MGSDLSRLAEAVAVDGVVAAIFFGSHARGEADEHCDYDVLVIFREGARCGRTLGGHTGGSVGPGCLFRRCPWVSTR